MLLSDAAIRFSCRVKSSILREMLILGLVGKCGRGSGLCETMLVKDLLDYRASETERLPTEETLTTSQKSYSHQIFQLHSLLLV